MKFLIFLATLIFYTNQSYAECLYSYDADSSLLEWTAFKTTARMPVKGHFKKIDVSTNKSAATIQDLIKSLTFSIDAFTVSSGDAARDVNLLQFFFKKALTDGKINGKVQKITGKTSGDIEVKFTINGKVVMVPFTYTIDGKNRFTAKAEADMLGFGWKQAHKSIHEACKELHKGDDGESKTWTDLSLYVTTVFKKSCGDNLEDEI